MKALKSPLAKKLLADSKTREQLRRITVEASSSKASRDIVTLKEERSSIRKSYVATVVPKPA